jgi:hypothetical protein
MFVNGNLAWGIGHGAWGMEHGAWGNCAAGEASETGKDMVSKQRTAVNWQLF